MKVAVVAVAALLPLVSGCSNGGTARVADVADPDLRAAVAAVFETRCVRCHSASSPSGGLSLTGADWERSLVGAWSYMNDGQLLVKPGAPEQSFLVGVLKGSDGMRGRHSPSNSPLLSDSEIGLVERWISSLRQPTRSEP